MLLSSYVVLFSRIFASGNLFGLVRLFLSPGVALVFMASRVYFVSLVRLFVYFSGMGGTQVLLTCNLTRAAYRADFTVQHHILVYGNGASRLSYSSVL